MVASYRDLVSKANKIHFEKPHKGSFEADFSRFEGQDCPVLDDTKKYPESYFELKRRITEIDSEGSV